MRKLETFADLDGVANRAAELFIAAGQAAQRDGDGVFRVALSGGSTPKALHALLVAAPYREQLNWAQVEFYWGDERCVPADSPDSNYGMALHTLLAPLGIADDKVFRMRGEDDPATAAQLYDELLGNKLGPAAAFDLVLLGMGPDGHTASLFPGSPSLSERARRCVATVGPKPPPQRLTLTLPVLTAAKQVVVLMAGADKADALARVLPGAADGPPLARVDAAEVTFVVDQAAAAQAAG